MAVETRVYLVRHGIAEERSPAQTDETRALTPEGEKKTRKVAERLRSLNLHFDLILTSPLVRAQQTARILQDCELGKQVEIANELAPAGQLERWLDWLLGWQVEQPRANLAIVGHQPNLGDWAEQLVWGTVRGRLVVKKAGVIGITVPEAMNAIGNSELFWLTSPRLLL
ncbi:phosphohistidine phosphatase SixA [Trichothermofontia sichuanensis B231]|uniref:phosphohistidine phosphatase SixA n=1 Tax=Trichothermofontia sichuanensis TaxID=3045816 RepID=UPI0022461FF4|nr:phosphohistidine phosphatase SixA [Trichothermofontia sichuanensis]UZQ54119.1 phosphohistidine phosphatase SixA [Trichothermofontia sichuanensis B231]